MSEPNVVLINRTAVASMLGCSRAKTYKLQRLDKGFPEPARDPCGTQMWRRGDVVKYINSLWEKTNA